MLALLNSSARLVLRVGTRKLPFSVSFGFFCLFLFALIFSQELLWFIISSVWFAGTCFMGRWVYVSNTWSCWWLCCILYLLPLNMFLLGDLLSWCLLNLSGVCYLIDFDRLIIGFERKKTWVFFTIIWIVLLAA